MRSTILTFLGLLLLMSSVRGQVTTEGRDFWLGYMHNLDATFIELYISAEATATVTLTAPLAGWNNTITVNPGISQRVNVPLSLMPTEEGKYNFGIHITSDSPISVYALNKRQFSADAAVILPTPALGKEYYVTAHMEPPGDIEESARESEFLVVATEDNTEVEITPSALTYNGWLAGVPQTVVLNAGETYQVKADADLSGSYVRTVGQDAADCKNVAVFGGNVFTNVGGCGGFRDHLLEQMFPVSTWGKNFMYVPYQTRIGGDYIKIIASENDTRLTISGMVPRILNAGEVYINKALNGVRSISADKPISVAQFSRSQECDGIPSDPFMIIVSPLEQRIKSVTFNAFIVQTIENYYLTLITASNALNNIEFDGTDITNQFIVQGNSAYASLNISQGNHRLTAPEGVIAYVYGYGQAESFGYSAGASLENLNAQLLLDDPLISVVTDDQACLNSEIQFSLEFDVPQGEAPRYSQFDWHFDDGTTASGQAVPHTYTKPGIYNIKVVASDGVGSCGSSEVFTREVTVLEVDAKEIIGAPSVCPNVDGIEYTVEGAIGNAYDWTISEGDGVIAAGQGTDKVTVNWGEPNDNAYLKVLPKNSLGCVGDTLTLSVKINKELEPITPIGPADVCFQDYQLVTYSTLATNGSEYTWEVIGGEFVPQNSNTGSKVTVKWNGVGNGRIRYLESNPFVEDCDGYSEYLEVAVYGKIGAIENIKHISCNGLADGQINLNPTGGKPGAYTVEWDNGMNGTSISGLKAGDYTATIIDAAGCEISMTYTISQPEPLQIINTNVLPVRCFQESNGSAILQVVGGTPDGQGNYQFKIEGNNVNRTTSDPDITSLKAGDYTITVTDANGCSIKTNINVAQPPLLEVDLESFINEPICPQATNGTTYIEAIGGTPDYQFYWSNNPTVDSQSGSGFSQGTHTLRLVDSNGCETIMDFEIIERFPKLFLPNAFSPNGDGMNDEFKPVNDCNLQYTMQIFNQWGSVVFATEDIDVGWDGTFKGSPVQMGQYSYIVFYSGSVNGISFEETRRGSLKLIR